MQFPRKPFLDRVIVEVTPVEKFYEQSNVEVPLDDARVRIRSDRGIVRAIGDGVAMAGVFIEMPVEVGDEVFFDSDNAYAGQIWMLPSDKNKHDLPEYLEIRVGDLLGRSIRAEEPIDNKWRVLAKATYDIAPEKLRDSMNDICFHLGIAEALK